MVCEAGPSGTLPPLLPHQTDHQPIQPPDVQFWANLFSMETASNECLSKVRSLLGCPSGIAVARGFRGNEAQTFVDFLDRVSGLCGLCLDNLRH